MLTAVLGGAAFIAQRLEADHPAQQYVEMVRSAGQRAASLTRQLLAFSRRRILEPKVLNLNTVVAEAGKMLQRLIGERIELVTTLSADLGQVEVDPGQVEQVILNLVLNARDAMPEGGTIALETGNVELDEQYAREHVEAQVGPHVMLAVSDTGVGMNAATQARIFEAFFTTKEEGKGTGLATVYGIVKQSGDSIWVYSEVGKGTTFKVYLPRADASLAAASVPPPPEALRGTETVLLVELSEQMRMERPDISILLMSGYTHNGIIHQEDLDEHTAFIAKPFTPEDLTLKVRQVLDA